MLKKSRKIVSAAVAFSLIVAMETGLAGKPARAADDYEISNPVTDNNGVTTWDKVKFGSYYQTAEFKTEEPIKWRVLSVNGDDAFLLADQCLDGRQYTATDETAEEYTMATWETCSLRKWLNEDFYNEAFSDREKAAIRETVVNNLCGEVVKNDTTDRIYLLSVDEVCNADYGFKPDDSFTKTREAQNTDYAKCNNASNSWGNNSKEGVGEWWLRTGTNNAYACYVYENGSVNSSGDWIIDNKAVRPALHLSLSSSAYTDAGEVDSEGSVTNKDDGISAPTKDSQGVTTWDCVYLGNWKKAEWKKEPIEWRVLSVHGDDAFLLADKCLDGKPYNTEYEHVTWEACSLRKWLNENFYNEAFSSSEQAAIRETAVVNGDNPDGIEGGNDTTDRIYLLSLDEVCNADYGFVSESDTYTKTRVAENTDYAKCNNAENSPNGLGSWRLRSPGTRCIAALVDELGRADCIGTSYWGISSDNDPGRAVRPALHLDLSSDSGWSYAGTVTSDGTAIQQTPSPAPTVTPTRSPGTVPTIQPPQTLLPPSATDVPLSGGSALRDNSAAKGLQKGDCFMFGNLKYKITKLKGKKGEITVAGVKSKKSKSFVIPQKVKKGITFTVTSIQKNAFKGCKKAKTLTIKATGIRRITKNALSGLAKRIQIKIPKSRVPQYWSALRKLGYSKINW